MSEGVRLRCVEGGTRFLLPDPGPVAYCTACLLAGRGMRPVIGGAWAAPDITPRRRPGRAFRHEAYGRTHHGDVRDCRLCEVTP